MSAPHVSIVIPTLRRNEQAIAAAKSALAQRYVSAFEVVLVDNDPAGSALAGLRALANEEPRLAVVHEPRAGLSYARNAGLGAAKGDFIAFLDDDEIAPPSWLAELMRIAEIYKADVVFGPVRTKLSATPAEHAAFFEAFFAREPGHAEGLIEAVYGCGCSLIRRAALPAGEPFSLDRNEIGGEDDLLFEGLREAGRRFAWAPEAWVWETPEPSRVSLAYTLRRAFAYGQGPATREWSRTPRNWPGVAWWMAAGAAQLMVRAPLALGAFLARTPARAFAYRKVVEAAGKLFWMPLVKPRLYGAAQLKRAFVASSSSTSGAS